MRRTITLLLAAALLLTACNGDPEVREPDPSASPTASPAPEMPKQATEDSDEGRVAFVLHWIDVFNYAQATGEVRELRSLSSSDCDGCNSYIDLFEETYERGGYFKDSDWDVVDSAIDPQESPGVVFVRVLTEPSRYRTDAGSEESTGEAQDSALVFEVPGPPDKREVVRLERSPS